MASSIGTISGVSSGIQWRDMVDQIIALEGKRSVTPLQTRQTALSDASAAWSEFQSVVARFRDAAQDVRDGTTFGAFTATAAKSPSTSRDIVSVSTDATAQPGIYSVEVEQLAVAEKLSSAVASSTSTALGVTGAFAVNGKVVTLSASDTLSTLREKVNTLNSGTSPSGVTASLLRTSAGSRLVLSADHTGAAGVELTDDAAGTLRTIGFADSSSTANITSTGNTQSNRFTSASAPIATVLGMTLPSPSTIRVGGQTIAVDLSVDSLTAIANRINAATSLSDAATVVAETFGGNTYQRLQTRLSVQADLAQSADSVRTLAVLGFTQPGRSGDAQVVKNANMFTDAGNGGSTAIGATLLTALQADGLSAGISVGDTITITGKRGDGSVVSRSLIVQADSTLQSLISSANDSTNGFAATNTRTATLALSGGTLALTDGTAGDSQLAVSVTIAKADNSGSISLGSFDTANGGTVGRSRQISAGVDARFMVDGQVVMRSSNSVSDVITGVTLNLLAAEDGTPVDVTVSRNLNDAVTRMQAFATAYNDLRTWADTNSASGKRLAGNTALRSMVSALSSQLLTNITGLTGSYSLAAMAGVSRDKTGVLSVDATTLKAALTSNYDDVRKLFSLSGVPTDSEVTYVRSSDNTQATATPYAIAITQPATVASITGFAFSTYNSSGTPDTVSITDSVTGHAGSVTLTNGDSLAKVVANLNAQFATQRMNLIASTSGGAIKIASLDYGSTGGFSIAYSPGSADATAQLGLAAGTYHGLDVAGTIGGFAATGAGQYLTGNAGTAVDGLQVRYLGSTARSAGSIAYSIGVGGMLYNAAASMARDLDGQVATLATASSTQADALSSRIADAQDRLATRRAQLISQFIAMESAMSKAQSTSAALTAQINGLLNNNNNNS